MDRYRLSPVLLAVLATTALATAAAILPSATSRPSGTGGGPFGRGDGNGGLQPPAEGAPVSTISLRPIDETLAVLGVLVLLVIVVVALVRRRQLRWPLLAVVAVLLTIAALFRLASLTGSSATPPPGLSWSEIAETTGTSGTPPSVITQLLVVGVSLLLLAAVTNRLGLWAIASIDRTPAGQGPSEEATSVGRAAGRAADRLEAATDPSNEIYRAWTEMTEFLDVSRPESSTPGEFAAAAIDAGMGPGDVDELTRLFEDVRYGPVEPTVSLERRAIAVLRRIEETYAAVDEGGS